MYNHLVYIVERSVYMDGAYISAFNILQEMSRNDIEIYHYCDAATFGVPPHRHDFYELNCLLSDSYYYHVENNRYLLDYTKIKGVELYLSADFKDNKLALLQIMTPFPEYKTCNKETKDMSRSFAEVGYALMGVKFDAKKQCTTTKGSASAYLCTAEDYACVYQLCPDKIWALACSVIDPQ